MTQASPLIQLFNLFNLLDRLDLFPALPLISVALIVGAVIAGCPCRGPIPLDTRLGRHRFRRRTWGGGVARGRTTPSARRGCSDVF